MNESTPLERTLLLARLERLSMIICGTDNIRDVIPYPRTPGNCEY